MASAATTTDHVRDELLRLVHRGMSVADFSQAVGETLTRVVPAEGTCLMTTDPATMLPTAEYVENGLPADAMLRMVEIEVREPDFNKWTQLALAGSPAASLSDATAGDLDRSTRQREIRRPGGFADGFRVVLSGGGGTWGALTVFRESRRPNFSDAEVRLVSAVAGLVADGLRRSLLLEAAVAGDDDAGPLILDADDHVSMSNAAAERWLDVLGAGARAGADLPLVVPAVARQARTLSRREPDGPSVEGAAPPPARARARTATGRWLIVRGSMMGDGPHAAVAVMLEPARRAEMAPLMAAAYGFTERERRITELVARGLSTQQIATRLRVSTYTVQDHLKSIFTKSDSGSRGDLVARLFLDHHAASLAPSADPVC